MLNKFLKGRLVFCLFLLILCAINFWVCSKNPPLGPDDGTGEKVMVLASLVSAPTEVAPGQSSVIQALVIDQTGQPAAGQQIQFSSNLGTVLPSSSTTDESGQATTIFTAPTQPGTAVVTANYGTSQSQTVPVEVKDVTPETISLIPDTPTLLANGVSSTQIKSIWRNDEGEPLRGIPVLFSTTHGTITASATTDSFGLAEATLTSEALRTDAVSQITAAGNSVEATTSILFRGINMSLNASPNNLIADGRSTSTITVILKETTSTVAIANAPLTFGASLGTIPNSATTNSSGVTEVLLSSTTETGVSSVVATYGQTLPDTVQVSMSESVPSQLTVSVTPPVIIANGQSKAIVTAVVSDQASNPVSDGTQVNFEIIDGTGTIESNKSTVNGVASSTLTSSSQPDTAIIVVRVDPLSDTTSVRYVVGEPTIITMTADSSSLPADGKTSTGIIVNVFDEAGNRVVDGTRVDFTTNIGDVTPTAQTNSGEAVAQFSSSVTGTATVRALAGSVSESINIQLLPGPPNSILLAIDPNTLGVKDSGRNQTVTVTATVIDSKNNPVADGTFVAFSIFASPGGGEFLSSTEPLPTLNGSAQVSLNTGIRSGSVRVMAQVTDSLRIAVIPEVRAISTEIIIFAGPPFIEDVNDQGTSHLSVGVEPLNVLGWNVVNNTATVVVVVGDKFNNPVPEGTAVFFTTSAGVISTFTGFTDDEGVATVTIHTAQPRPTITRFYNTFFDPNRDHPDFNLPTDVIPGPIPDFDFGEVLNSIGDFGENDGVTRILAVTEGVDSNGNSARAWSVTDLVFSGTIDTFYVQVSNTDLSPGESSIITFTIYDENGNPIVPGSEITISASAGVLSWSSLQTGDPGDTKYVVLLTNNIDPTDPEAQATSTPVTINVNSPNGKLIRSSETINLNLF